MYLSIMWIFLEKRVTIIAELIGTFYVQGPPYTEGSMRRSFNMEKKKRLMAKNMRFITTIIMIDNILSLRMTKELGPMITTKN